MYNIYLQNYIVQTATWQNLIDLSESKMPKHFGMYFEASS